jgi:hypothetical protein
MILSVTSPPRLLACLAEAVTVFATNYDVKVRLVWWLVSEHNHEPTITISVVSSDFFTNRYRPKNPEGDIFALAEKFTVIVAIMLKLSVLAKAS